MLLRDAIKYDDFVDQTLKDIAKAATAAVTLDHVLNSLELIRNGLWLEFGVHTGGTIAKIAAARGNARVFGFDSFEGLPEDWRPAEGLGKGTFALNQIPKAPDGAEFVVGWFNQTLPKFHFNDAVTLVHIDCDLYSSARCALEAVRPHLIPGSIIVFDELLGYADFKKHEMLALYETHCDGLEFRWFAKQGLPWNYSAALQVVAIR